MTATEQNFLNIISSAFSENAVSLIDPVDYDEIFMLASRHKLLSLVFEKLCEDKNFKSSEAYSKYRMIVMCSVLGQSQRTATFIELYDLLNKKGIYPIVVKGLICRQLYGKYSDHRPSSDEDIIVRSDEYKLIHDILIENNYYPEVEVLDEQIENIQAVGFYNKKTGLNVEVHINPIGKNTYLHRKMDSNFHNIYDNYIEAEFNNIKIRTLPHSEHFLFLVMHAFKHFLGNGFGVRQVIDILLYAKEYQNEIKWKYIIKVLKENKAYKFFSDLVYIGRNYLNIDVPLKVTEYYPQALLENLIVNGIYGNETKAQVVAGSLNTLAVDNEENTGWNITIFKKIFPSKNQMLPTNPELKEKPWLLPCAWVQRWIRIIKRSKSAGTSVLQESISISNKRVDLLKKYGVVK